MTYEEYMIQYEKQIEEAKKKVQTSSFEELERYTDSQEYKNKLEIVRQRDRMVHENILYEIEMMQREILNKQAG